MTCILRWHMTHDIGEQLRRKAIHVNGAAKSVLHALQLDLTVIEAHLQDAQASGESDVMQRLSDQRDRSLGDVDVLQDQMPILERLASGRARQGREAAALLFVEKLAHAFLLAIDDIAARAKQVLTPAMIERLPAWEVESARASAADAERAATLLKQALDDPS